MSSPTDVFPSLYCCTTIGADAKRTNEQQLFDVKFYPYPTAEGDQVFAVVGLHEIFVCRIDVGFDPAFEVLKWFKDTDLGYVKDGIRAEYNSVVWTKHPTTRKPLLCIAGKVPKQIQLFDLETGDKIRTLVGHGKGINDLAVSPLSTNLIFSASEDYTIRLWNIEPAYEANPCVAVFAGEGHKQPILALNVHPNGRWMLSGGLDTAVCLWAVPSVKDLDRDMTDPDVNVHDIKTIYYPHFHSTEVHHNYVDCIVFYGDLIISRAATDGSNGSKLNDILLWKIDGFDPKAPAPADVPIPVADKHTRSSFPHEPRSLGFQRLLTFDMPHTARFYKRFGLLHQPGMRPILAMGNEQSKFCFWDLQKFEEGYDPGDNSGKGKGSRGGRKPRFGGKMSSTPMYREQSIMTDGTPNSSSISAPPERKYALDDPFSPIKPHRSIVANTKLEKEHFGTSAVAWSPDGTWVVGVGDRGMLIIFHRDKSVV